LLHLTLQEMALRVGPDNVVDHVLYLAQEVINCFLFCLPPTDGVPLLIACGDCLPTEYRGPVRRTIEALPGEDGVVLEVHCWPSVKAWKVVKRGASMAP